ncbi:MAG: aminopeptidase N [Desulfuromonadales bacterium GWC2_61_20]|nr:MAG: aminopeptidase N [Desulfuromonadales bacterium GWC2_61_20]
MSAESPPRPILLRDYRPPAFSVSAIDLHFDLAAATTTVRSRLTVQRNPLSATDAPLVLAGRQLELLALRLNDTVLAPADYTLDSEGLTLPNCPDNAVLEIETAIHPAANTALEGLYLSSGILCSQCEAQGFRKITYYPDRPDVMARFSTTLVADRAAFPVLLANGNLVAAGELEEGRHFARWDDPHPKPCYLFALVAGALVRLADRFTTASGRQVVLEIYVEARNRDKCAHAMASLQRAMRWDEETFGLEYDLDRYMILAVDDFNFGAMENKGLNIFNSKYVLASPATATDADYQAIEEVIGHEYFHNWTGNRVTCRDWFQLSLKEGLTVFRDQEFAAAMTSAAVKRISDVRLLRSGQFPEDAGPLAHPVRPESYVEINNFYTATVYNKGAEVIRMYQTLFGREGFVRGVRLYLQRFDGEAVTTDDFLEAMAEANDADLAQFGRWYSQAGTPRLQVATQYDAAAGAFTLTLRQSPPPTPVNGSKEPWHIPVAVGLLDSDGADLPLRLAGEDLSGGTTRVLELRREEESFRFVDIKERPVPSLLRNFSAPVRLEFALADADLAFLFAHDSDPFNRWEAGQLLAGRTLLAEVAGQAASRQAFVEAFGRALATAAADPAFFALALTLPGESYLAELVESIDPLAIHNAREGLRRHLGQTFAAAFHDLYTACRDDAPYTPDAAAAGRRSLKNLCLAYLLAGDDPAAGTLAQQQYASGSNMTDVLAALAALAQQPGPERTEAFADFYARWQDEPLVVDKWFSLQATSVLPQTLEIVSGLLTHPAYNPRNPNRVRALLGAFAHSNPARFHRPDGAGYRLLSEQIRRLDGSNPQLAARMAGALSRWQRYQPPYAAAMRQELESLAAASLSRDLFEVVSKSLGRD